MLVEHTNLKCTGCNKDIPKENYSIETGKATWYAKYDAEKIIEWICAECWSNGIRYKDKKK